MTSSTDVAPGNQIQPPRACLDGDSCITRPAEGAGGGLLPPWRLLVCMALAFSGELTGETASCFRENPGLNHRDMPAVAACPNKPGEASSWFVGNSPERWIGLFGFVLLFLRWSHRRP